MTDRERTDAHARPSGSSERAITLRGVTAIMAAVVGLTFLFGFGNVWTLALRLGVPPWVAPLVAPAVDLSVLGLLLGTRYLALHGASPEQLGPARRLLVISSVMTLALNVTDPLLAGQTGKAAFDAVGPMLLIGWAEVGPGLLQAISGVREGEPVTPEPEATERPAVRTAVGTEQEHADVEDTSSPPYEGRAQQNQPGPDEDNLFERARREDTWHWEAYRRPISAETLRKRLRVGAARSRMLVAMMRADDCDRMKAEGASHDAPG
ncbi:SpdA protein [Streptomyces sp. 5-6(2022)]|uniref:SpdA protein n=1 Tax=Streptomyces sp. 5-6(2022) TaxID=2936510 RepID=UPI0023B98062|nr:SpdA protein [Streptomyces sp. 5-6(2022)]